MRKTQGESVPNERDGRQQGTSEQRIRLVIPRFTQVRIIHECRREAFETEARLGFSHVRPTQAYLQSVEETEREKPCRARGSARRPKAPADRSDEAIMNSPGKDTNPRKSRNSLQNGWSARKNRLSGN
jgi:hypothetical protein